MKMKSTQMELHRMRTEQKNILNKVKSLKTQQTKIIYRNLIKNIFQLDFKSKKYFTVDSNRYL